MAKRTKNMIASDSSVDEEIRLNKYLSDAGVCSRREADKYIETGMVTVDGVTAVMGMKVKPGQEVIFKGKKISQNNKLILIAFNKPRGIVCTTDRREKDNIIDYLNYSERIYPIGRLDKDSEGLILLTNDGSIVNKILRAGNNHEKEYIVTLNKPITAKFLKEMASGVPILDTVTRPCEIKALDKFTFQIILTQGLNRQIRRMCEYFDYRVMTLKRIRIMNINLGHLQVGGYRNVTDKELEGLKELIQDSINNPVDWDNEGLEDSSDDIVLNDKEKATEYGLNREYTKYRTDKQGFKSGNKYKKSHKQVEKKEMFAKNTDSQQKRSNEQSIDSGKRSNEQSKETEKRTNYRFVDTVKNKNYQSKKSEKKPDYQTKDSEKRLYNQTKDSRKQSDYQSKDSSKRAYNQSMDYRNNKKTKDSEKRTIDKYMNKSKKMNSQSIELQRTKKEDKQGKKAASSTYKSDSQTYDKDNNARKSIHKNTSQKSVAQHKDSNSRQKNNINKSNKPYKNTKHK